MLDVNYIRKNLQDVEKKITAKGLTFDKDKFTDMDTQRRRLITESEILKSKKNKLVKKIGYLKKEDKDTHALQQQTIELSKDIEENEKKLNKIEEAYNDFLLNIPNLLDETVPIGKDESENVVIREWGEKPVFEFKPKPHWDLGKINGFLDLERSARMSGSRFALYFNSLAKLERVLINFMMDVHTEENGYIEVLPPFLVNDKSLTGTGNLPKFKDDLFKVEDFNLYLIPTAEVPLTNIHQNEVLMEEELPKKYVSYTPCFRSEAGSHGKDIRGIIRQHQFNKVELLKFTTPQKSNNELELLTKDAEAILQQLNIHYRVVALCSGDLSFSAAKTYDIEAWMPERNGYLEISSCSNFTDFQSRRAKIKYKTTKGEKKFLHTLNGSGLAVGRTVAAIMENYQTEQGKIRIPEILQPYFNNTKVL